MTPKKETRRGGKGIPKLKKETLKDLDVKGKATAVKGGMPPQRTRNCAPTLTA